MDLARTSILGMIAGGTILLGLPIGRLRSPAPALRTLLSAGAVGILLFLFWDVLSEAWEPIDAALADLHAGHGGLPAVLGFGALFAAGLGAGLLGLFGYERWMDRAARIAPTPERPSFGPGAQATAETAYARRGVAGLSAGSRLAVLIAVGVGLHNFAEGLAIGRSAAVGDITLATVLVIGFALHNATEGFGIVAPITADSGRTGRPGWPFLFLLGAIGGGPTIVGTIVGHSFTSEPVAVVFLSLAAGSILYVAMQLLFLAAGSARRHLVAHGLLVGLLAGFLTDAVVSAGGA